MHTRVEKSSTEEAKQSIELYRESRVSQEIVKNSTWKPVRNPKGEGERYSRYLSRVVFPTGFSLGRTSTYNFV